MGPAKQTLYRSGGKRLLDVTLAASGLFALAPVLLGVAAATRVALGSPVLFRQKRPGREGKPFTLLKFRTMKNAVDRHGQTLPDGDRLTRFGRWIRASSLDELPELINVLRGEMSLVGPRPLLMRYLGRYDDRQSRRHEVRPGLTGRAQVSGRNGLGWTERLECDVEYVDHYSLWMDLGILVRTVKVALSGTGVSEPGQATMREFMGTGTSRETPSQ